MRERIISLESINEFKTHVNDQTVMFVLYESDN